MQIYKQMQAGMVSSRMKMLEFREVPCETATEIKLPCLMAVCGSVCAMIKVFKVFYSSSVSPN